MCDFKSVIITKQRVYVSETDSHTDLLDELSIDDTIFNARTKFVRAELSPPDGEWWRPITDWVYRCDQDILPCWYKIDEERHIARVRIAVNGWINNRSVADDIDIISDGTYFLNNVDIGRICGTATVYVHNCNINIVEGFATIIMASGQTRIYLVKDRTKINWIKHTCRINKVSGESIILNMCDNVVVGCLCGDAVVRNIYGYVQIKDVFNRSIINNIYNYAHINQLCNNSIIRYCSISVKIDSITGNAKILSGV